ncbi:MAG: AbrB/MazE/SpoVT family DNA-binding domain-containing protein [Haloarculaceae archaeon]
MSADDGAKGETTRITRKGQVTIPKDLREEYGLKEGDELVWLKDEDGIKVRKANRGSARGMLVPEDTSSEKREEIAQELEKRIHDHRSEIEDRLTEDIE